MSQFTADTLMPLVSALPENELHLLQEKVNKMLQKKDKPKNPKKTVHHKIARKLGPEWLPENQEMLISNIMTGNF